MVFRHKFRALKHTKIGNPKKKNSVPNMSAEKVKKPLSSYLCFCQEERETFKAQNPDAGMTDILKLMGEAWKDMPQAQRAVLVPLDLEMFVFISLTSVRPTPAL
jgi:hypothetical protein